MHLYRWRLHLQWGFTLIREGAVIQASILFKDTLLSLKVLTHWVKLSREDKKVSSSQEVTAARFSTPCTLLEKCHNCQLKEKWLCCHLLLMTGPHKKYSISLLKEICFFFIIVFSKKKIIYWSKHQIAIDLQKVALRYWKVGTANISMELWGTQFLYTVGWVGEEGTSLTQKMRL